MTHVTVEHKNDIFFGYAMRMRQRHNIYNTYRTPQAAYCSCSGAVHVTDSKRTAIGQAAPAD